MTVHVNHTTTTQVKKIIVGKPVRRVRPARFSITDLTDVDLTNLQDGSLLIYDTGSQKFEANINLEKQNINGGNY